MSKDDENEGRPVSSIRLNVGRFTLVYGAASVVVPALLWAVQAILGLDLFSTFAGFIPFLAGAMVEGQMHVLEHKAMPANRDMWRVAFWMGAVGIAISLVITAAIFLVYPVALDPLPGLPLQYLVITCVIIFALAVVLSRFFLGVAVKLQMRAIQRQYIKANR